MAGAFIHPARRGAHFCERRPAPGELGTRQTLCCFPEKNGPAQLSDKTRAKAVNLDSPPSQRREARTELRFDACCASKLIFRLISNSGQLKFGTTRYKLRRERDGSLAPPRHDTKHLDFELLLVRVRGSPNPLQAWGSVVL